MRPSVNKNGPSRNGTTENESNMPDSLSSSSHQSTKDSNAFLNRSSSSSSSSSTPVDSPDPSSSMYRPIIFQYKCRGGLYLDDSDNKKLEDAAESERKIQEQSDHDGVYVMPRTLSTPKCVGLESRLKKLQELPPMTKEDSLRAFMWHSYGNATSPNNNNNHNNNGFGGGTASNHPRSSEQHNHNHHDDEQHSHIPQKRYGEGAFSTMAFYGSTDISVLMLRDSKKAEVVAVAPECKLGLTIREAGDTTGGESLKTLRLGDLVEITFENEYEYEYEEEEENKRAVENVLNQLNQKKNDGTQQPFQRNLPPSQRNDNEDNVPAVPRKHKPKPTHAEETDEDFFKKVIYAFSKTADSMQNNAKMIKDELQDDFPARFLKASDKIIGNFGKTLVRTQKVIEDVYKMWSDNDDE